MTTPDAIAAIRLTLLVAAVCLVVGLRS